MAAFVACCGAVAGYAAARAQGPAPVTPKPVRPPDARIWKKLEDAARILPAKDGARAVAVAEVSYPRSAAEAKTLAGQALLLVSTMAEKIGDAAVERATLHFEDGEAADLRFVTSQTNDIDDEQSPAVRAVGRYRHDSLFFIPVTATGTKAYVTTTYAGRTEVVITFPRAPGAYASNLPVMKPDWPQRLADVGTIGRALYPFFRTAPLRSPGAETTCTLHEPPSRADESPAPPKPAVIKPSREKGPGTATVRGSLDKEIIRGVIRAHIAEVQSCYERELWTNPKLTARVMVRFTIAAEGWVTSSALQSSTVDNKPFTDCIVGLVRCWRFPKPVGGGIVVVNYPFVLLPGADAD